MVGGSENGWVLVLGASSGFGAAVGLEFARAGYDVFGVHLDRKATMNLAEEAQANIKAQGREAVFFNVNAADPDKRTEVLNQIEIKLKEKNQLGSLRVLVHSLAFGTLKPLVAADGGDCITQSQMEMTLDVMANSLIYWTQDVVRRKLIGPNGRVYAMTSSGGTSVWPTYGAVSAAKAALESHCRQLALELAPLKITANSIKAGVTDTPALRKIPGNEKMIQVALNRNPYGRLTTPEDVAKTLVVLARPETYWLTGNTLGVDGGEDIVG